ncbi:hypothetical protein SAMN02910265_02566 [Ruminococcus flavefaciens]|jgi:hypothetical protein|uniref:Septum formation initiator n=1 Tax=Ruminococcus flavefaciens TaxID=1265 RepID=A0A1H6KU95_RUMFL|nr:MULTISPECIES: hypothetical protein [Ruminococcus]SEH76508.1 hypothetical protein SAMN02910265_02566 [Ruminococcus flavefaciens]
MRHEKEKKKGLFNRGLVKLAAFAVIIGCGVLIASTQKDCAEKEEQVRLIQTKIDDYETENAELQRVLDSDDLNEYMEKVALEERGYAYPDERRFYDTTRD